MEAIKRAWRGEEKLWKVFWLYGVVGGILINIAVDSVLGKGMAGFAVKLPWIIWNTVSLWRCAWNAGGKFWGIIVRILVVLTVIVYVFSAVVLGGLAAFFGGSAISGMAECQTRIESAAKEVGMSVEEFAKMHPEVAKSCFKEKLDNKFHGAQAPSAEPVIAAPQTVAAPAAAPTPDACEQQMIAVANQYKVDAQGYIAQNQAWLAQCRQSMAAQPQAQP